MPLLTRNTLSQSVSKRDAWREGASSPYARCGERKYLNASERRRFLDAIEQAEPTRALLGLLLAYTGARLSEVLTLSAQSFDVSESIVTIVTLKRRGSVRQIPIPPKLMARIARHFDLHERQRDSHTVSERLWSFSRVTAWRFIRRVMVAAGISGRKACPRGLRHAFGVGALQSGVPVTLVQRWMGHSRLSTTSIYLNVSGPEEIAFAQMFWRAAVSQPSEMAIAA